MDDQRIVREIEEELDGADVEMARRLQHLNLAPSPRLVARVRAIPVQPLRRPGREIRPVWIFVVMTLLLVSLTVTSPAMQAAMIGLWESAGNPWHPMPTRLPFTTQDMTPVGSSRMSLKAARAAVAFEFYIPQTAPTGWVMDDEVTLQKLWGNRPDVGIRWIKPGHEPIVLNIHNFSGNTLPWLMVAPGSVREAKINGQLITIIEGDWDLQTGEWQKDAGFTLQWIIGKVQYTLSSSDPTISLDDLLSMVATTE